MIYLFGDNHGHFDHIVEIVQRDRPAAIILLGDLDCPRPLHELVAPILDLTEVWWIPGNHDSDGPEVYRNLFESELTDRNLHGRIAEIDGLRIAGLGGIFRGDIWFPPDHPKHTDYAEWASIQRMKGGQKRRLSKMDLCQLQAVPASTADIQELALDGRLRKHRTSIFFAEYERLYGQSADVLVTHEAPSCHRHGFEAIDELAQSMGVRSAFHGHHHVSIAYSEHTEKLGFRAYGVGFCAIMDREGKIIRPGDRDEARRYRATHPEGQ